MNYKETPFGKIPQHWDVKPFSEVISLLTDYVANGSFASLAKNVQYKEKEDVAVLIRLVDFNNDFKGNFVFIDEHAYEFLSKSKLFGGEIIISNVGANVGTVFRCPKLAYKMSLAPNSVMVKFSKNNDFYYYWLKSQVGQHMLQTIVTGSAQPKFNKTNLKEMLVPVPPIKEQKRIADILLSIDKKILGNKEINDNLSKQITTYFIHLFIDNEDSTNWETNNIGSLVEDTLGGDWSKDSPIGNNTEMVYCIRGADIPDVKFGNKGKMPIRYILPKNYAAKKLHNGDLVVEISGGSPTQSTGRVAYISESLLKRFDKGLVCTNFCRAVKPKTGWSMFLYTLWQYLYDKDLYFVYENGTTGIKNFDLTGFLEKEKVSIPPAKLLEQFNQLCTVSFDMIFKNGLENEKLANLRDSLLPKLMSGEIDVDSIEM